MVTFVVALNENAKDLGEFHIENFSFKVSVVTGSW